jgi:hypothetical protein
VLQSELQDAKALQSCMPSILAHLRPRVEPSLFLAAYKKSVQDWIDSLKHGREWQIKCRQQLSPFLSSGLSKLEKCIENMEELLNETQDEYNSSIDIFNADVAFLEAAVQHPKVPLHFKDDVATLKAYGLRITERLHTVQAPAIKQTLLGQAEAVLSKLKIALDSTIQFELQGHVSSTAAFERLTDTVLASFDSEQVFL